MLFKTTKNILIKRLKFIMPILFFLNAIITISIYSLMLRYIYQQFTPLRRYSYFFIMLTTLLIIINIYYDFRKVERGKYLPVGILYILKTVSAFIIVALFTYPVYILEGTMTVF